MALRADGFEVTEASTGEEGLFALAEREIGVVRLDIMLPDVDGSLSLCANEGCDEGLAGRPDGGRGGNHSVRRSPSSAGYKTIRQAEIGTPVRDRA